MESRIRIVNVKLVVCFILVGLLGTSRQYDSNCMIRFYAVQQCQCPCWSFNGTNWNYSSDTHKYSDEVVSPSRSNFGFKCIRTFSNDFYQGITKELIQIVKHVRFEMKKVFTDVFSKYVLQNILIHMKLMSILRMSEKSPRHQQI